MQNTYRNCMLSRTTGAGTPGWLIASALKRYALGLPESHVVIAQWRCVTVGPSLSRETPDSSCVLLCSEGPGSFAVVGSQARSAAPQGGDSGSGPAALIARA